MSSPLIVIGLIVCCLTTIKCSNIIIIGAGPSGIAAATRLLENGITNITILEAEDRIGGRVNTKDFGDNVVDLGAAWCHGETGNVVFELANPLGLLDHSKYDGDDIFVDSEGNFLANEITSNLTELLTNIAENQDDDMENFKGSLGEYINKKYEEKSRYESDTVVKKQVLDFFEQMTMVLEGSDNWFEVSAKKLDEYRDCDGDQNLHWKGRGYKTIFDVLMKKIPDPNKQLLLEDKILLNKEVVSIKWNDSDLVIIECKDGNSYTANYVLVTVSLGVLKDRHLTLFTPELPNYKQNAISTLGFGTVDKLIFKFPHRWWEVEAFALVWNDKNDITKVFPEKENQWLVNVEEFFSIDEQPNVLIAWIAGESAHQMESLPEVVVKTNAIKLLRHFLDANFTIPDPDEFIRTRWFSNPHFCGSYSHQTVLSETRNASPSDLAKPLKNANAKEVLFFAGEATHEHYYSTVHGAIETGWREADHLISQINSYVEKSIKP